MHRMECSGESLFLCISVSLNILSSHRYNTYKSVNHRFPMDPTKVTNKQPFNHLFSGNCNNEAEFCQKLEHLFLQTDGFAVLLDQNAPWFIRREPNHNDPLLCFSVNATAPYPSEIKENSYLDLKLNFYSSANIRTVSDFVVQKSGSIPVPKAIPDERLFTYPGWHSHSVDSHLLQSELTWYADQIVKSGFTVKSKLSFISYSI